MKPKISALSLLAVSSCLAAQLAAANGVKITPDVVYGHKDGMALTFDVLRPASGANRAAVLVMVSGGWISRWSAPEPFAGRMKPLLDTGFTVFLVRHGSSPKYNLTEAVADVRRAVRYVRLHGADLGIDPNRIGVTGGSAGGHLALMLGTASDDGDPDAKDEVLRASDRVAAVVAYFPPVDLRETNRRIMAGVDVGMLERFRPAFTFDMSLAASVSPLLQVTPDDAPTLLVHGDKDLVVDVAASRQMHKAFQEKGVPTDLIVIEGAGHGFQGEDAARALRAMVAWFDNYLAQK